MVKVVIEVEVVFIQDQVVLVEQCVQEQILVVLLVVLVGQVLV